MDADDVMPGKALITLVYQSQADPDGNDVDLLLLDTQTGQPMWHERNVEPYGNEYEWDDSAVQASSSWVGVMSMGTPQTPPSLTLIDLETGSSHERPVEGAAGFALSSQALIVVRDEGTERIVERISPDDLQASPLWQERYEVTDGGGAVVCTVAGMVVIGQSVHDEQEACTIYGEARAFDIDSGSMLDWSKATSVVSEYHAFPFGIIRVVGERDENGMLLGSAELMAVSAQGVDLWSQALSVSFGGEYGAAGFWGTESGLVIQTVSGVAAFDPHDGRVSWQHEGEVSSVLGVLDDKVIVGTPTGVRWLAGGKQVATQDQPELASSWGVAFSDHRLFLQNGGGVLFAVDDAGNVSWSIVPGNDNSVKAAGGRLLLLEFGAASISGLG